MTEWSEAMRWLWTGELVKEEQMTKALWATESGVSTAPGSYAICMPVNKTLRPTFFFFATKQQRKNISSFLYSQWNILWQWVMLYKGTLRYKKGHCGPKEAEYLVFTLSGKKFLQK